MRFYCFSLNRLISIRPCSAGRVFLNLIEHLSWWVMLLLTSVREHEAGYGNQQQSLAPHDAPWMKSYCMPGLSYPSLHTRRWGIGRRAPSSSSPCRHHAAHSLERLSPRWEHPRDMHARAGLAPPAVPHSCVHRHSVWWKEEPRISWHRNRPQPSLWVKRTIQTVWRLTRCLSSTFR